MRVFGGAALILLVQTACTHLLLMNGLFQNAAIDSAVLGGIILAGLAVFLVGEFQTSRPAVFS